MRAWWIVVLVAACSAPRPVPRAPVVAPAEAPAPAPAPGVVVGHEHPHLQIAATLGSNITAIAWSTDGRYVATVAKEAGGVRIWDAESGGLVRAIDRPGESVVGAAWPGREQLVLFTTDVGANHRAIEVDLDSGKQGEVPIGKDDEADGALPGGGLLVDRYGAYAVLDRDGHRRLLDKPAYGPDAIQVASDGALAIGKAHSTAVWWTLGDGHAHALPLPDIQQLYALDGGRFAVREQKRLVMYDATGAQLGARPIANLPSQYAVSASGTVTASAEYEQLVLDSGNGGPRSLPLAQLGTWPFVLAFDPSGARLAVASRDNGIAIVDVATASVRQRLGFALAVPTIADFIDDDHAMLATSRGLLTLEVNSGRVTGDLPVRTAVAAGAVPGQGIVLGYLPALDRASDQPGGQTSCKHVIAPTFGSTRFGVWGVRGVALPALDADGRAGTRGLSLSHERHPAPPAAAGWRPPSLITCLPATPLQAFFGSGADRRDIATGHLIVMEDASSKPPRLGTITVGQDAVHWLEPAHKIWESASLSRDARRVVAMGTDDSMQHEVLVWNRTDGKLLQRLGPVPGVLAAGLSPDGNRLALAARGQVVVLDVDRPPPPTSAIVPLPVPLLPSEIAVADDGTTVVTDLQGAVAIVRGRQVTIGHGSAPGRQIAISPDGRRAIVLASGGADLWRLDRNAPVATLYPFEDGEWITVASDGVYDSSFEASRRVAWQFDAPLATVDLARYGARYHAPAVLAARLAGTGAAAVPPPPRPPHLAWSRAPRRDGDLADVELSVGSVVREVLLFADGIPAGRVTAAAGVARGRVTVPPSASRMVAVAYGADGVVSSTAEARLSGALSPAVTRRPRLWVVAIGVADYPGLPESAQLRFPDDDAHSLADALAAQVGPGRTFHDAHVSVLANGAATTTAILAALHELAAMAPDDVAIVSFAGHGVATNDGAVMLLSAAALDHPQLADDEALGWTTIANALAGARGRVLVLLDACHAGSVSEDALVPNADAAAALVRTGRAGLVVLAASKGRQSSLENAAGGLFTQAVVAAIADAGRRGQALWVSDLVTDVQVRVGGETAGLQMPWLVAGDVFGDFPLVAAKR